MNPHTEMQRRIEGAAASVLPALEGALLGEDGCVLPERLQALTVPISRMIRKSRTPTSAVYLAWDAHGSCRYVGSVHRPRARAAVRDRLREHMQIGDRRGRWYAVTMLPIRAGLTPEIVRECEGVVARLTCPREGTAHPVPSVVRSIAELVASSSPRIS